MPARILLIEDNPANLELMVYLLQAFGYAPASADDGEAGLAAARAAPPDLIVCDVHLPKLDGYGVLAGLKQDAALRYIPVLAVTALAMVGDRDKILAAGFDGYIAKPITPEDFVPVVESFLRPELRARAQRNVCAAGEPAVAAARPAGGRRGTILAVDDTPANIEFVRSVLEPNGYRVVAANLVATALGLAEAEPPDLILCDLHMAPLGGDELLSRARLIPALADVPLVFISASNPDAAERGRCLDTGAARFLLRPIEPQLLLDEIECLLKTTP